jgi:SRSO17 transposase
MRQLDDTHERSVSTPTAATARTMAGGQAYMADVARRLAPYFARSPSRDRVVAYLHGWLSAVERQHSWPGAEVCGESTPYGFQYVLSRADWDADAVRDERRSYSTQHRGDPHGVLVLDESGFLKKGRHSAGVARQYRGTAGNVDNCQSGVFLSYASPLGQVLRDRELSLPQEWTGDRQRCRQAGLPEDRRVAPQPQLAQQRLARAFAAGVPARWVTGDSVSGADRRRRRWLEAQPHASVLAVSGKAYGGLGWHQRQVKTLLATLPEDGWTRLNAGDGAKGPRWYDWRWLPLAEPLEPGWRRWLLGRRSLSAPADLAASVVFVPQPTTLEEVVRVAGRRGTSERGFEVATGEVGLDHYEVRSWTAWYRHMPRAMWALALLTVMRAGTIAVDLFKKSLPPPQVASPLAAFRARRGLASPGV